MTTFAASIDQTLERELPAAASGCQHAYGRIVLACQNTVTAIALAITRDRQASEDIAQEAVRAGSSCTSCAVRPASCRGCGRSPATWPATGCARAGAR